jgi:hypothetical protein
VEMKDVVDRMKQKKAVVTYLAAKIPEKNFEGLKHAFMSLDRQRAGKVDNDKFIRCLQMAKMSATEGEMLVLV